MAAQFVVRRSKKKNAKGKWHFSLVASNGDVIVTSEGYDTRRALVKGIEAVRRDAVDATVVGSGKVVAAAMKASRDARDAGTAVDDAPPPAAESAAERAATGRKTTTRAAGTPAGKTAAKAAGTSARKPATKTTTARKPATKTASAASMPAAKRAATTARKPATRRTPTRTAPSAS